MLYFGIFSADVDDSFGFPVKNALIAENTIAPVGLHRNDGKMTASIRGL